MIRVDFVNGIEWDWRMPKFVATVGLSHRLAVIQDSYVEGAGAMVFDEVLWRTLVDFIARQGGEAFVAVDFQGKEPREVPLASYMDDWEQLPETEREPPAWIALRADGRLVLCMITEYWTRIGGPQPYSDSYTYSLISGRDVTAEVVTLLNGASAAGGWELGDVRQADDTPRPWWRRVLAWLSSWW